MDYLKFLRDAETRTREAAWNINPCADAQDKTKHALQSRADEWKACADEMQRLYDWQQGAKVAADAILAPLTAEIGRLLEEAPDYPITIEAASHEVIIPAKHFMALYRATDT